MQTKPMELRCPATALSHAAPPAVGRARVARRALCGDRRARRHRAGSAGSAKAPEIPAATLERLEGSLLSALLDVHPNRGRALGRLLDDVNRVGGALAGSPLPRRRAKKLPAARSPASHLRIEELLVAVVIVGPSAGIDVSARVTTGTSPAPGETRSTTPIEQP